MAVNESSVIHTNNSFPMWRNVVLWEQGACLLSVASPIDISTYECIVNRDITATGMLI